MARRFTDSRALLGDLLDRHEAGVASPIAHPDHERFGSVVDADAFLKEIDRAEQAGAVKTTRGRGTKRDQIVHVRLVAPEILYSYLGRKPVSQVAEEARARLVHGLKLHPGLVAAVDQIAETWARARSWSGFGADDADRLHSALTFAQAILDKRHLDADYRTFSRRIGGHSKTLERNEGAVVRLLRGVLDLPPEASPREALRTLGLEKFAPPLLIGGRVDLADAPLSGVPLLYVGLPANEADRIRFREPPAYVLTIENFASFNRHLIEADPVKIGTTIYVGGYPSLAAQQALARLEKMLPKETPLFHWSDIDHDGTWIFRTIERAVGRRFRPHLMSPEIAERFGTATFTKATTTSCPPESGIFDLAKYLCSDAAKTLEQEEMDPCIPV